MKSVSKIQIQGSPQAPEPSKLKSLGQYRLCYDPTKNKTVFELPDPIEVPADKAFRFKIQIEKASPGSKETHPPKEAKLLYFTFKLSNNIKYKLPEIKLNTISKASGGARLVLVQ